MENLLEKLKRIEEEHKDFFEKNNIRLTAYVSISQKPVMLRFNTQLDAVTKLPNEIYVKVNDLIMSYYGV
jgi:hypothetical protein